MKKTTFLFVFLTYLRVFLVKFQVGDNVVEESGGPYSSHSPPFVQKTSWGNTSFHSPIEGHVDHYRKFEV